MENYLKKVALGRVAESINNKPSVVETDPEIRAATEAAISSSKRHWWKRRPQADIILSPRDRQVLRKVKSRAWYLDKGFKCCCFQVGLDGIVGLIPFIGDFIGLFLALNLVRTACKADLPSSIIMEMLFNVAVDFLLGLTPIAGDILDIMFKCNWRNAMVLEEYLFIRRRDELRAEHAAGGTYGSTSTSAAAAAALEIPHPDPHRPNKTLTKAHSHQ